MPVGHYLKRVLLMLAVALPAGALVLTSVELTRPHNDGPLDVFGGALMLVYVWGAITGTVASLVHTAVISRAGQVRRSVVLITGVLIGAVAGGLTPTFFTGILEPAGVGLGSCVGLVYATVLPSWDRLGVRTDGVT